MKREWTLPELTAFRDMAAAGYTNREMARILKRPYRTIWGRARVKNFAPRRRSPLRPEVIMLWREGLSGAEIRKRLGISRNVVAGLIHREKRYQRAIQQKPNLRAAPWRPGIDPRPVFAP